MKYVAVGRSSQVGDRLIP